jgi:hypothetical protein
MHLFGLSLLILSALLSVEASAAGNSRVPSGLPAHGGVLVGPDGLLAELPGQIRVRIAPGSQVSVERKTELKLTAGPPTTCHVLRLASGRVDFEVPERKMLSSSVVILVFGPRRTGAVSQGGSGAVVASDKKVTIANFSGKMSSAVDDQWQPLSAGWARTIDDADRTGSSHRILAPPEIGQEDDFLLALDGSAPVARVTLKPIPAAKTYELTLVDLARESERSIRRWESTTAEFVLEGLEGGSYGLRARAIDARGLPGYPSALARLHVLHVGLPKGGAVREDQIELSPDQHILLRGTEGVFLSYGGMDYLPAPPRISLASTKPVRVQFKLGAGDVRALLTLIPRKIRADISIRPRQAKWPEDEIDIVVRVENAGQRSVPLSCRVVKQVTINAQPVALRWTRRGMTWRASVPTQPMPGPWVLRVEVSTEFGERLGRQALEVAPSYELPWADHDGMGRRSARR